MNGHSGEMKDSRVLRSHSQLRSSEPRLRRMITVSDRELRRARHTERKVCNRGFDSQFENSEFFNLQTSHPERDHIIIALKDDVDEKKEKRNRRRRLRRRRRKRRRTAAVVVAATAATTKRRCCNLPRICRSQRLVSFNGLPCPARTVSGC